MSHYILTHLNKRSSSNELERVPDISTSYPYFFLISVSDSHIAPFIGWLSHLSINNRYQTFPIIQILIKLYILGLNLLVISITYISSKHGHTWNTP